MNAKPNSALHPWSKDLEASRDVHPRQCDSFTMVLTWFEMFRSRSRLAPGREACVRFWTEQVKVKERPAWQLEQWTTAIEWYLRWVKNSRERDDHTQTLEERVRDAVERVGCRRCLARLTRETYSRWAGSFARWTGDDRAMLDPGKARDFLTWLVAEQRVAFSTQKLSEMC